MRFGSTLLAKLYVDWILTNCNLSTSPSARIILLPLLTAHKKAIELEPNDAVSYNIQGSALLKLWRYEEVLKAFDKAIELEPDYTEAYTGRGNALNNLGRYEEAIVACNKAIALKSDYGTVER